MEITHEKACHCALNRIFGFEPKIALAMISHFGSAAEIFNLPPSEMKLILGPHSKYNGSISTEALDQSYKELETLRARGVNFIGWNETDYPAMLKECEDAPVGLYIRGTTLPADLWNNRRAISIIGTRDLSPYGKEWCERLVSSLAEVPEKDRPVIVSGLALGVDICAHTAALKNGLPTIGVMATGPDDIYPSRHRGAAETNDQLECPASAVFRCIQTDAAGAAV